MGDCYRAILAIPKKRLKDIQNLPSYKEVTEKSLVLEDNGVIYIEDEHALDGRFHTLEADLIALKISFDRVSSGYLEMQPEERRYRPATDKTNAIDTTITLDNNYDPYIKIKDLKKILHLPPADFKKQVKRLINSTYPDLPEISGK